MLKKQTHIEGLETHSEVEMFDDTNPGATQTVFSVECEEMPFLSNKEGRIVRKNFIHVMRTKDLGRSSYRRRIRDKVEFVPETGKWKIVELAKGSNSDIRKNPDEWNAFMRGTKEDVIGTPLSLLFKNDPSLVAHYKSYGITTIEHLAKNEVNIEGLGMDAGSHVKKAQAWIKNLEDHAPSIAMNHELEQRDAIIAAQQKKLADLEAKLTEILTSQIEERAEVPRKRGRPAKIQIEQQTGV